MADFEAILKLVFVIAAVGGVPAVLYLGFRWAMAGIRMLEVENEQAGGISKELAAEVESLRARVADLEEARSHLLEVEERLDFTERLLAQRPPEQLRRG